LPDALASTESTRTLVWGFLRPLLTLGSVSGAVSALVLAVYLGIGPVRSGVLILVGGGIGTVFVLVNSALITALGQVGRVLSILAVIVTAAVGIASTSPSTMGSLSRLLPLHDAGIMVHVVTMGGHGFGWALVGMAVWSMIAVGVFLWAVERLRTVPARLLRPSLQM
jgi:putative membrane protein